MLQEREGSADVADSYWVMHGVTHHKVTHQICSPKLSIKYGSCNGNGSEINFTKGAVTVIVLLLQPIVLLYKLLFGRNIFNAAQQSDAINPFASVPRAVSDAKDHQNSAPNNKLHQQSNDGTSGSTVENPRSASSLPTGEHEVFLSFRGPDTRQVFTNTLFILLRRLSIRTFMDDEKLEKGDEIWPSLATAIRQSKIHVAILSENYAYSKWCLRELVKFVECRKQDKRHIILPIFYMVDPGDVRHQTGPYQSAFQQHEKKFDSKTVQDWRDALNEVGTIKGWTVGSKDKPGEIAYRVCNEIWLHIRQNDKFLDRDRLVGIDDHIRAVTDELSLDSEGVTMVGLHGLGGIGKTTIARAVYNQISTSFDRCSFLENIREMQEQKNGTIDLQHKLISNIMRKDSLGSIDNDVEGKNLIKDRVSMFKVLIILDDVDEKFKFEDVLGNPGQFASGTRFIITSRNEKVLRTVGENQCKLYEVGQMSPQISLELFCKHAFKKTRPPPGYETLSQDIISIAGGLPLFLEVVGSLLYGEEKPIWEEKLVQLRKVSLKGVTERLKISYDVLEAETQQIFLDIACFCIGMEKEIAIYMWSDLKYLSLLSRINSLIQRSMIKIGYDNKFQMHDQMRDMGREIVREENIEQPWKRSRIWDPEEALELLQNKRGSKQVKALCANFTWIPDLGLKPLERQHFLKLPELRYLEALGARFNGDFGNIFPNLRWLRSKAHRGDDHHPTNFHLRKLVILDLSGSSNLDRNWGGWSMIKAAEKLKVLDLSRISLKDDVKFLEFPESGSLEILNLSGCHTDKLDGYPCGEVDITRLWNLKVLNLQGIQLKAIRGGTIGMLEMLRELNLTNFKCGNLKEVIVDIKELSSLKILKTIGAGVPDKPSKSEEFIFGELRLDQSMSEEEEELKEEEAGITGLGIKLPTSLNVLHTSFWFVNLVELLELEELEVEDCDFGLEIPHPNSSTWSKVSKLTSLTLKKTKIVVTAAPATTTTSNTPPHPPRQLSPLSSPPAPSALLPSSLAKLHVSECPELEWLPSLEKLENLTELVVRNCNKLREIRGLQDLKLLRTLVVDSNRGLLRLFGLVKLVCLNKLQTLEVTNCPRLAAAFHDNDGGGRNNNNNPPPTAIDSLQHLHIHGCESLLRHGGWLPHLSHFPKLKIVEFGAITSSTNNDDEKNHNKVALESLVDGIACLEELEKLRLFSLPPSIEILPSLSRLQKLTNLAIHDMPSLREIQGIADLKSLERLMLAGCTSLERLIISISPTTTGLRRLKELDIRGCNNLAPQDLSALRANLPDARIKWPDERYPDSEPWSWGYCSVQ